MSLFKMFMILCLLYVLASAGILAIELALIVTFIKVVLAIWAFCFTFVVISTLFAAAIAK